MQRLKSKKIEGRYINPDEDKTILATWESETLLVLDFYDSAQVNSDDPEGLLGTLKIQVK